MNREPRSEIMPLKISSIDRACDKPGCVDIIYAKVSHTLLTQNFDLEVCNSHIEWAKKELLKIIYDINKKKK